MAWRDGAYQATGAGQHAPAVAALWPLTHQLGALAACSGCLALLCALVKQPALQSLHALRQVRHVVCRTSSDTPAVGGVCRTLPAWQMLSC